MVAKKTIQYIKRLQQKKYRDAEALFVVEGFKGVVEFLNQGYQPVYYFATSEDKSNLVPLSPEIISNHQMKLISSLKTPPGVLAVFPKSSPVNAEPEPLMLYLDDISDPGNLGTIIRLCDWFGLKQLLVSPNTVDAFNPKVVQASMGSLARLPIIVIDYDALDHFILQHSISVYCTAMDGTSVYDKALPKKSLLIIGNESH
ncbi:MAG: RNA methyltransferase, partial [Flavobacteriaceae bacterium]|nr:RNA methyltransferase [Flavobacteriaceae bacterium]